MKNLEKLYKLHHQCIKLNKFAEMNNLDDSDLVNQGKAFSSRKQFKEATYFYTVAIVSNI